MPYKRTLVVSQLLKGDCHVLVGVGKSLVVWLHLAGLDRFLVQRDLQLKVY